MKIESSSLTSRPSFGRVAVLLLAAAILAPAARAASQTWAASPTDANWSNSSNWGAAGAVAPGTATGATTNDVATFNSALSGGIGGSGTPIVIDTSRSIGGITFTGSSVGAYVIGSNAGNVLTLGNTGNAPGTHVIQLASSVANSQIIAAPIKFAAPSSTNGGFGFINNAASSSVTLSLTGAITSNSSSSRPGVLILDGTNTGTNVISGSITSPAFAQSVPLLVKRGVGTWILSGANNFSGGAMTSTTGTYGIQVLDGVLSVQNNQALGTSGTASSLQTWVGIKSTTYVYNGSTTATFTTTSSGGTLELGNSITLDNGVQLNLLNGGTVRSNGSTTSNAGINLSTAAAVTATLSTVGASDLFTVGNAANDLTGGAGDTVINIAGPGTVFLSQASNYAGTFLVNSGTLRIGSPTALGSASTAAVAFGASSTGTLQLNANNLTVVGLNTNATPGTPAVENGTAGASVLTVNNASNGTYAGVLRDGAAGTLAFTKGGAGTQTLSGVNTFTGGTIISSGTLALGATGSINNSSFHLGRLRDRV